MPATISPADYRTLAAAFPPPTLIDARLGPAFAQDPDLIPGAVRGPGDQVHDWALDVEPWRPAVVYCVRGHDVGRAAAESLRAVGINARARRGWRHRAVAATHPLGHTRATQDRPHRVPVADPPLHRPGRRILSRSGRRRARVRGHARRHAVRRA